ncbi:MAG: hypothetical protein NTW38_01245 [Candidatus Aminicenantes bacterium]|nr:hypothetical protein [Candidatus Aminicenantes bacterium]
MIIHQSGKSFFPGIGATLVLGVVLVMSAVFSFSEPRGGGTIQDRSEQIAQIRELYAQIQDRISIAVKEAEGGSPPEFYSTEIFVNRHNGSWRASGTYSKKTVFWYTDQPEFAREEPGGELSVLAKIEIDEIVAVRAYHREYLFDQGKLVFAFIKNPSETGTTEEFRYYFSDGALIRYMEGQRIVESNPGTAALEAEVKTLQTQFLSTF